LGPAHLNRIPLSSGKKTKFAPKKKHYSRRRKSFVYQEPGYDLGERPAAEFQGLKLGVGSGSAEEFGNAVVRLVYSHKYRFGN
jgi:hypothetical protein